jgi:hypothetical protein
MSDFNPEHVRLKRGDTVSRVQGKIRDVCWKGKREVYTLSNMHIPHAEGNFKEDVRFSRR